MLKEEAMTSIILSFSTKFASASSFPSIFLTSPFFTLFFCVVVTLSLQYRQLLCLGHPYSLVTWFLGLPHLAFLDEGTHFSPIDSVGIHTRTRPDSFHHLQTYFTEFMVRTNKGVSSFAKAAPCPLNGY